MFASTPKPPYYAVIFSSKRTDGDNGYAKMAQRMAELACEQAGFLGAESVRENGFGITVSYWTDKNAIMQWKNHAEHKIAQETGKTTWYADYKVRICLVEHDYGTVF